MRSRNDSIRWAALAAGLALLLGACKPQGNSDLPKLAIEPGSLTVSGVSSGGYMATQFQVAYSGIVRGAGVIAAGPWFCARASLPLALSDCLDADSPPSSDWFVTTARASAATGYIDATANLHDQRVWVFHGTKDTVVSRAVSDSLVGFYKAFVKPENLAYVTDIPAAHGVPTLHDGISCDKAGAPFLNACNYDAIGAMLQHLYGTLAPPTDTTGDLRTFAQGPFDPGDSLAATGFIYVPKTCTATQPCRLHVALHGCLQGENFVGREFVTHAGYNRWADSNRLVILYPQTKRSLMMPLNPKGCWDWWGYASLDYATRDGAQLAAIRAMVKQISGF